VAAIGANAMAPAVRKRRRDITGRPERRQRAPAKGTMREKRSEAATHDGQGSVLGADPRRPEPADFLEMK